MLLKKILLVFVFSIGVVFNAFSNIVKVNPGDDLNVIINNATGGDTILISAGLYGNIKLENKNFSANFPLVIMSNADEEVIIRGSKWIQFDIKSCSYIIVKGLIIDKQGVESAGLWITDSNHIVIVDNKIMQVGHVGIHVTTSSFVDIIGNEIAYTGRTQPQYGEGIYVGSGSSSAPFPDRNDYIWIEDNLIYECGYGEGINIKSEVFNCTLRGNIVHSIHPSTDTQLNQAAISINDANLSVKNNYLLNTSREVWVENNTVYNVSGGLREGWNNGIFFGGNGVYVINNTVYNCADYGIIGHKWNNLGLDCFVYGNNSYSNGTDVYLDPVLSIKNENPGVNPNQKQLWYFPDALNDTIAPSVPSNLNVAKVHQTGFTLDWDHSFDNYGVAAYEVQINTDTVVKVLTNSVSIDGLQEGTVYVIKIRALDYQLNQSGFSSEIEIVTLNDGDVTGDNSWQNFFFPAETEFFTAFFDVIPLNNNMDGVIGFSDGEASEWSHLACIVRFYNNNKIDVRNGSSYSSDEEISYVKGKKYSFRCLINIPDHCYSVYVTPEDGKEILIADSFMFRKEQVGVDKIIGWATKTNLGSFHIKNMRVVKSDKTKNRYFIKDVVSIYPNPVTDSRLGIKNFQEEWLPAVVRIYDNLGKVRFEIADFKGGEIEFNSEMKLQDGLYYLILKSHNYTAFSSGFFVKNMK